MAEELKNLPDYAEESAYLQRTKHVLEQTLRQEKAAVSGQYDEVLEAKREFLDNAMAGKFMDANQYLESIQMKSSAQYATAQRIKHYEDSLNSPYFARVDFKESGYPTDKIYIGLHSVSDEENYETYVYDWRAPIASIFYRYEMGPAEYSAPMDKFAVKSPKNVSTKSKTANCVSTLIPASTFRMRFCAMFFLTMLLSR